MEKGPKQHQSSRADAKTAMAEATSLRFKESAAYAEVKADREENLGALTKAKAALESGMAGSFIQIPLALKLQSHTARKADLPGRSRLEMLSLLSSPNSEGYAPQSEE